MTCGHEYPKPVRSMPACQPRDYRKDPLSSQLLWAKSALRPQSRTRSRTQELGPKHEGTYTPGNFRPVTGGEPKKQRPTWPGYCTARDWGPSPSVAHLRTPAGALRLAVMMLKPGSMSSRIQSQPPKPTARVEQPARGDYRWPVSYNAWRTTR